MIKLYQWTPTRCIVEIGEPYARNMRLVIIDTDYLVNLIEQGIQFRDMRNMQDILK